MRKLLALVVFGLGGCVAAEFAPLPTSVLLPTHTTIPLTTVTVESGEATPLPWTQPAMPILLPTPPGAEIVAAEQSLPTPVPVVATAEAQLLSLGLEGRVVAPEVQVLAALPTRAQQPAPALLVTTPQTPTASVAPSASVVAAAVPTAVVLAPTAGLFQAPTAAAASLSAEEAALMNVPVFWQFATEQVGSIIERGRAMGNNAQVFTTLGDSNSLSGDFLRPLVLENYCSWGGYAHLQEAVRYFSVPPAAGDSSSFTRQSIAVQMGFNSAAALDPFWATGSRCEAGETPLACELRVTRPAAVIIMLGGKDVGAMSLDAYRANMSRLVDEAIVQGVVPVLTTFVVLPGREVYEPSLAFNQTLVDLARERGTPLINLWAAARALPENGIAADGTHLRTNPGRYCDFTGGEREYGGTLRNLLTLQALDLLRAGLT